MQISSMNLYLQSLLKNEADLTFFISKIRVSSFTVNLHINFKFFLVSIAVYTSFIFLI